jgi:NitT/TauT family transport system substrate-binding protein
VVFSSWQKSPWTVIGKPEIKSMQDLKGKLVGTTTVGSTSYLFMEAALKKAGMTTEDVQIRALPGTTDVFNLLMAGGLEAGVVSPPSDAMLEAKGLHEVAFIGDALALPYQGLGTTTTFISEHQPQVVGVLKAQLDAGRWLKSHRSEAVDLTVKYLSSPRDIAEKSVAKMLPLLSETGEMARDGAQQMIDIQAKASNTTGTTTPDQVADYGPLREALAKG